MVVDQRALPREVVYLELLDAADVVTAIQNMSVRGAPAIGVLGAFGVALSALKHAAADGDESAFRADCRSIAIARPTAPHLAAWVRRAQRRWRDGPSAVLAEALAIRDEEISINIATVARAADLVGAVCSSPLKLYTHCNTGGLATAGVGTALGTIIELRKRGRLQEVLVGETRPLLQGSRLTAWELQQAEIPYSICVDSAAAFLMAQGRIDCVLVGADRIASNGDTANKIGTYSLAVAAQHHGVPFVVVAPEAAWDRTLHDGSSIEVEHRAVAEVTSALGNQEALAPEGAQAYNPAFDITPAALISAIVTENRVFLPER